MTPSLRPTTIFLLRPCLPDSPTYNGVVVRPGTGTWQSITSLGKVQRAYFDPVSGQAAYLGLIEEGEAAGSATLRLKIEDKKITEAEWVIAREGAIGPGGTNGGNLYNLAASSPNRL